MQPHVMYRLANDKIEAEVRTAARNALVAHLHVRGTIVGRLRRITGAGLVRLGSRLAGATVEPSSSITSQMRMT